MAHSQQIIKKIKRDLKSLAVTLAKQSPSYTREFITHLDDVTQHSPKWHQFGILTHTMLTYDYLRQNKIYAELNQVPHIKKIVKQYLDLKIDGLKRQELLKITALLHDIGKFKVRFYSNEHEQFKFKEHELVSAKIAKQYLKGLLSEPQIKYICKVIKHHNDPLDLKKQLRKLTDSLNNNLQREQKLFQTMIKKMGAEAVDVLVIFWADKIAKGQTEMQLRDHKLMKYVLIQGLTLVKQTYGKSRTI